MKSKVVYQHRDRVAKLRTRDHDKHNLLVLVLTGVLCVPGAGVGGRGVPVFDHNNEEDGNVKKALS